MFNWLWERRRGLLIIGGVAVGTYYAGKFALKKFLDMQEASGKVRFSQENIKKRFEKNQGDCSFTVAALAPAMRDMLVKTLNAEELAESLRAMGKSKPENEEAAKREKLAIWEKMKILSFTRTFAALYSVVLLSLLIRIKINLIGRHTYRDSVAANEEKRGKPENPEADFPRSLSEDIERAYMTLTWHFLNTGIKRLTDELRKVVTEVMQDVSLKKLMSADDMTRILKDVRTKMDSKLFESSPSLLSLCLFPTPGEDDDVLKRGLESNQDYEASALSRNPALKRLLAETRDYLTCSDLPQVYHSCMNIACELFTRDISAPFLPELSALDEGKKVVEISGAGETLPLPKVIPIVNKQIDSILALAPNIYVNGIASSEDLEALGAVVFSALNDFEI